MIPRLAILAIACTAASAAAQASAGATVESNGDVTTHYETRAQLESLTVAATRSGNAGEAALLRARLEHGDFQDGDRLIVTIRNNTVFRSDTVQLRAGRVLQIPTMPDLSLEGVLRSEVRDSVAAHVARYVRDPEVSVTPLLPIAVTGSVANPGYYYTSADAVLRDLIMRAGGLRDADLDKVVIRRNGSVIWDRPAVRTALADGRSLDALHLRAGDELYVPAARHVSWTNILAVGASALAATVAVLQLSR